MAFDATFKGALVSLLDSLGVPISAANPLPVSAAALPAGTAVIGRIGGVGCVATATFTPSASAYGALDVIDVAKELAFTYADGTAVPAGSLIRVLTTVLRINQTGLQASEAGYSLKVLSEAEDTPLADNAAWTLASADLATYLGSLDLGVPVDEGAACFVRTQLADKQDFKLGAGNPVARLVTTPAFTPGAVARQVAVYGLVI